MDCHLRSDCCLPASPSKTPRNRLPRRLLSRMVLSKPIRRRDVENWYATSELYVSLVLISNITPFIMSMSLRFWVYWTLSLFSASSGTYQWPFCSNCHWIAWPFGPSSTVGRSKVQTLISLLGTVKGMVMALATSWMRANHTQGDPSRQALGTLLSSSQVLRQWLWFGVVLQYSTAMRRALSHQVWLELTDSCLNQRLWLPRCKVLQFLLNS